MHVIFDDRLLCIVFSNCENSGFTLVKAGPGTRPIHAIPNGLVSSVSVIAHFQLSRASASNNVTKMLCKSIKNKKTKDQQKIITNFLKCKKLKIAETKRKTNCK